jgi:hypothetical protein
MLAPAEAVQVRLTEEKALGFVLGLALALFYRFAATRVSKNVYEHRRNGTLTYRESMSTNSGE